MLRRITAVCMLLLTVVALGGCRSHHAGVYVPPEKRIETINNDSGKAAEPSITDRLYAALEDGFDSDYVLINTYTMRIGYTDAEDFIITRMRYVQKADKIRELMPPALSCVYEAAARMYPDKVIIHTENISYPNWQYLAATMYFAESERYLLYDIMRVRISVSETDSYAIINVSANPQDIRLFAEDRAAEQADKPTAANTYNSIRYTYAYLTALYDDRGVCLIPEVTSTPEGQTPGPTPEPVYYPFTEEYKAGLCYPLDNVPDFRDSWAQGRSNNSRLHTGTDIASREGYNVYAVSGGTVLYTGYDKIPGNFLIILDDYGFEYHYYHLVEIPTEVSRGDRVEAGDTVAHVGNTGNSDADHLHVSIIGPDGVFINPFRVLKDLAEKKPH